MARDVRSPYDEGKQWLDNSRNEANQIPVGSEMPFGGDVAEPDLYMGSDPSEFTEQIATSNLVGDQMIIAFFGTSANRFSNIQAVIETTDFGMVAIQGLAVTRGADVGPTAFQGVAGNSGSNLLPTATSFRALLVSYAGGDVTTGIGFDFNVAGGLASGGFINVVVLNIPEALGGSGTNYGVRSQLDGAGNWQISAEGDAPSRFVGARFLLPNLPTADPAVAGQLWVDVAAGRVIKQSAG